MNEFDLLNEGEKRILLHILKGLPLSQVADIYRCKIDEVNNVRLQIIAKFEKSSNVKIPKKRRFQLYCK
jgi:DNA-binding CsgD family transcriptional regulator